LPGFELILNARRPPEISVIVPYYNEGAGALRTLRLLVGQTLPPREILMVDSSSTDDGPDQLETWLRARKAPTPRIRSIRLGSTTPSSSKNIGVALARSPWLAFMDCGHIFSRRWLEDQWTLAKQADGCVYGKCRFVGHNSFDCCAVAQTYGFGKEIETIPGSLMKKNIFHKVGFFAENRRAGYDVAWKKRAISLGIPFAIPSAPTIRYESTEFAKNSQDLFLKSMGYARATLGLGASSFIRKYLVLILVSGLFLLQQPTWWPGVLAFYIFGRGYFWPIVRSHQVKSLFLRYPCAIILMPWIGFVCDFGRLLGIIQGCLVGTTQEHEFHFSATQRR